jgi:hypothetical protein
MLHDVHTRKILVRDRVESLGYVPASNRVLRRAVRRQLVRIGLWLAGRPAPRRDHRLGRAASDSPR